LPTGERYDGRPDRDYRLLESLESNRIFSAAIMWRLIPFARRIAGIVQAPASNCIERDPANAPRPG
jgi:hypothetical protein